MGHMNRIRSEEGNTLVLVALSMVALLGFTFLVLDGGNIYAQRRRMQNAADAGTLAGTRLLALGETSGSAIYSAIAEYTISRNGATSFTATYQPGNQPVENGGSVPSGTTGVIVEASREFSATGSTILGFTNFKVAAPATAIYGSIKETGGLWPMAVMTRSFSFGVEYKLWGDKTGPGGFGWLDWDGPGKGVGGTQELEQNLRNPANSGKWEIGDWVPSGPGVKASNLIDQALRDQINKQEDERPVTVILYEQYRGEGANLRYQIRDFAKFVLTRYRLQDKAIWGKFIRYVDQSKIINAGDGCPDGLCGVKFVN